MEILSKKETEIFDDCWNKVLRFFHGSEEKTKIWFETENPLLGNISPNKLIILGRVHKLQQFINSCVDC